MSEDDQKPCCDSCGERIRGYSYLRDGMLLCGLCLDDENNKEADERRDE